MHRRLLTVNCLLVLVVAVSEAQVAPDLHWRTLTTAHFRVTFSDSLEATARRAAGSAERAWTALAAELAPPRGTIDLVVADNIDTSNGYTTTFPSNRIVIYARPTVDATALRFLDDWIDLVVSHELAHAFHLDRSRGLWRAAQWVFGRNPFLFPNGYAPSWLAEGIAVHYETKLTGAGRDAGTDFGAIVRAHENAGTTPGPHDLSQSTPKYPLGTLAYTYGSEIVERAVARGGVTGMRDFVDGNAAWLIPYMLNTTSRRAFGISFDSAYAEWMDSTHREAQRILRRARPPVPLVREGWFSTRPRWSNDSTILYEIGSATEVPTLRSVTTNGRARIVTDRNGTDATIPLDGGWRIFAQPEFLDPYTWRGDLWSEHEGTRTRLTTGARLTQPDARRCDAPVAAPPTFCVVAVQLGAGTSRLVRVRARGDGTDAVITPISPPSRDTILSEPRWSRAGDRIVATRWMRGGTIDLVILSPDGAVLSSLASSRAVTGSPAWGAADSLLYFASDRSGRSAIYRANLRSGAISRVADSPTALYEVDLSPDGTRLATFVTAADGLDLVTFPALERGALAEGPSALPPSRGLGVATSDAPATDYSPWRSVLPRYWMPTLASGYDNEFRYGFTSSGFDLVGRHDWSLSADRGSKYAEPSFDAAYTYAGLGNPLLSFDVASTWDHPGVADSARKFLLPIERRKTIATGELTFVRRRFTTSASLSVGASYEWRDFRTFDAYPLSRFAPADRQVLTNSYTYPSLFVSAGFSNARQPVLALGPEDGISVSATWRERWRSDAASATRANSVVGTLSAYRAFDWGGGIHHLLAVRVAAGDEDATSATEFSAGGNSGSVVEVLPGVTFGDGRRTFFVRGFDADALVGSRAVGANAEYRLPLALPGRGLWALPVFFQRVSGVLFADAASAWCPTGSSASPICAAPTAQRWIASVGAELHLDAALQYDAPYRFRFGVARPVSNATRAPNANGQVYFSVGVPF